MQKDKTQKEKNKNPTRTKKNVLTGLFKSVLKFPSGLKRK